MKRMTTLVITALACAVTTQARDTEVSVSYGVAPALTHIPAYHDHWKGMNTNWGTVNATIDHRFSPALWCGLSYTFSTADSDRAAHNSYGKITWHGLMFNARYEWKQSQGWRLYSHAAAGALVQYYTPGWTDTYNRTSFAFQVSPVGIEADITKNIGAFAELGYGIQGICKAGLRIGF